MPGPPIGVAVGVGGLGKRPVHPVTVVRRRRAVGSRPDERVRERDTPAHIEEPCVHGGARRHRFQAEDLGATVQQQRITQGLRRGCEDQELRLRRQQLQPLGEAPLDPACDRLLRRDAEAAGEIDRAPGARQLEQRQRIAVALIDDLHADRRVHWAVQVLEQQRACSAIAEPVDRHHRESGEDRVPDARSRCADECDPLGEQSAGDEQDDLRRGVVEPVCIIDHAEQRAFLGHVGEQCQHGEPDHEPVGGRAGLMAEHRGEGASLRGGEPIEVIQHRRTELVQPAERELHLRLDADGGGDAPVRSALGDEVEQRALAGSGVAAQYDHPALAGERVGQDGVKELAFSTSTEKPHRSIAPSRSPRL